MDVGKEGIETESRKPLLDAFQFIGISRCNSVPNSRYIYSNLDPTRPKIIRGKRKKRK
jgi:hypothetical protein